MTARKYGWLRGHHDQRDRLFVPRSRGLLPDSVDLRDVMPPVYDQGSQGSCVANGCGALADALCLAAGYQLGRPSRSHIYYQARARRGWQASDTGSYVRDGLKVIAQEGVVPESEFPYFDSVYNVQPNDIIEEMALRTRIAPYAAVAQNPPAIMQALADGHPIVFGCTVYSAFENVGADGLLYMPDGDDWPIGGHCMVGVGYSRQRAMALVRNSYGGDWGYEGHLWMPFDYLCSKELTSDLFVATGVLT